MDPEGRGGPSVVAYAFAGGVLDVTARRWTLGGSVKTLEPKTFALLLYLLENRDRVVPREELRRALWRNTFVCKGAIPQCVWTVRRNIGDRKGRSVIATVSGVGYRFVAPVCEHRTAPSTPEMQAEEANAIHAALARLMRAHRDAGEKARSVDTSVLELASACQAFADAVLGDGDAE